MLAIWFMVPLPFLNPAWTSWSSRFTYCWSLAWRILSITLLECEMSAIVQKFEHSLALSFFGIGMKTELFQSCGHCWVFQICWNIGNISNPEMMLWKCCTQYASKFGRLSSSHRTGKGQFSFQSQRKAMPKNAQTTTQLHSSHTLVKGLPWWLRG